MKITMYELLGMVKDGKQPQLIKYKDYIYSWDSDFQDYVCDDLFLLDFTNISEDLQEYLQCTLEIIEEEKKIPEKLGECAYVDGEIAYSWSKSEALLKTKINEIIDCLKSKGE